MEVEQLKSLGLILRGMVGDGELEARVLVENPWFVPALVRHALAAVLEWFEGDGLAHLKRRYPEPKEERRIGLILAGNIPLVGLHDVLVTLLCGHRAVVKPSHKDGVLLRHLLQHSPPTVQSRVHVVESIPAGDMDFLIATGSNLTAQQLEVGYAGVPKLIRRSRYSVAVLDGRESWTELRDLGLGVLGYHGLGCRSISCILVPRGYHLAGLVEALEAWGADWFAHGWWEVLRYERARLTLLGKGGPDCSRIVLERCDSVQPGRFGVVNIVEYADPLDSTEWLEGVRDALQCVYGRGGARHPFGMAQRPALDDYADGVDTMGILTSL